MTKKIVAVILAIGVVGWLLTGCGHTDYPDLGRGTWSYHGHGHS